MTAMEDMPLGSDPLRHRHRARNEQADADSEGDQVRLVGSDAEQERCEVRMTRYIACAALLVAGLACVVAALFTFTHRPVQISEQAEKAVVDETVYPLFPGVEALRPGWAKCVVNAVVRKGHSSDSERLAVVSMGGKVLISEVRGRRVRISEPVDGWLSAISSDGIEILRPWRPDLGTGSAPKPQENLSVQESLEQLKEELSKFKGMKNKLVDVLDLTTEKLLDKAEVRQFADRASEKATEAVSNVRETVQNVDLDSFDPETVAKDLAKGQVQLPGGVHLDLTQTLKPEAVASEGLGVASEGLGADIVE